MSNSNPQDRDFALKLFQTAFGITTLIILIIAGYKIIEINIGIVKISVAAPTSNASSENSYEKNVPMPTEAPPQQIPDPEDFLRYYFGAITTQRNYDHLWSLQTDDFHREASNNSFDDYVTYWNTVDSITIKSIDLYDQTTYSVRCRVKMNFHKNDASIPVDLPFYLIYDNWKSTWVFDVP